MYEHHSTIIQTLYQYFVSKICFQIGFYKANHQPGALRYVCEHVGLRWDSSATFALTKPNRNESTLDHDDTMSSCPQTRHDTCAQIILITLTHQLPLKGPVTTARAAVW